MSYYKERVVKAAAIVRYAEEGFWRQIVAVAKDLLESNSNIDTVPEKLEQLLLEYEAVKEAREDLERAEKYCAEREAEKDGSC